MISNNITPIVKIRSADNELYMKRDDLHKILWMVK